MKFLTILVLVLSTLPVYPQDSDDDFTEKFGWYTDMIRREVSRNWYIGEVDPSTPIGTTVWIDFTLGPDGTPGPVSVVIPSDHISLNKSCVRAVRRIKSFGPLPAGYNKPTLSVLYHCTYPGWWTFRSDFY